MMVAAAAGATLSGTTLAVLQALGPLVALSAVIPVLWFLFRSTWSDLDQEAALAAVERRGVPDKRPLVMLVLVAVVLTVQEYYGGRSFFNGHIRPWLQTLETTRSLPSSLQPLVQVKKYNELYGYAWWTFSRFGGYVIVPFLVWKAAFPKDSLLDMGLRLRGFFSHAWLYLFSLAIVLPATWLVSHQPDFGSYYPFYKQCSRSWFDFVAWETLYGIQFLGLEIFFRGFMLNAARRSLGSSAIFVMIVPYCMIHFGKPYLEACGAIIAGIFLASLSMKTKSIYQGFLVHLSVAITMDTLALSQQGGFPTQLWP